MLDKPSPAGTAMRILVVEDDEDVASSLAMLLDLWGHHTQVMRDAGAVVAAVQSYRPNVVLMDIGLPRISGYELAQQLRDRYGARNPVLVAMTGYGDDEHRRQSEASGFQHHLVKPVDPDVLQALL